MSGEELMEKLMELTPEQRKMEVVVRGDGRWFYGTWFVCLMNAHEGIEQETKEPNCIAIM